MTLRPLRAVSESRKVATKRRSTETTAPFAPSRPGAPGRPGSPAGPREPVAPSAPSAPCGPVGPVGPCWSRTVRLKTASLDWQLGAPHVLVARYLNVSAPANAALDV